MGQRETSGSGEQRGGVEAAAGKAQTRHQVGGGGM